MNGKKKDLDYLKRTDHSSVSGVQIRIRPFALTNQRKEKTMSVRSLNAEKGKKASKTYSDGQEGELLSANGRERKQ